MSSVNRREGLLNEALVYVTKDRNSSYGEPEDNFQAIADIWNAQGYCKGKDYELLTAVDVALMMTGMKLARLRHNAAHRDSWVDMIGYGACGGGIALDDGIGQYEGTDVVEEYVYANDSEPLDKVFSAGWVSGYRCGHAEVHESHKYTRSSAGAILWDNSGPEWCDGYAVKAHVADIQQKINSMASVQRDVDAVKRVADKGAHDLFKKCGQFPRCSVCGPQAGE